MGLAGLAGQWQTWRMDKYDELRQTEIKAWQEELRFANQRGDRKTGKRIRHHLREVLGHWGGLGNKEPPEDSNQTAYRVMQEVVRRSEQTYLRSDK